LIAAVYFAGFSGIWLTFALFFQDGLGFSPLESGLAVAPFSIGSAVSSLIAGRLVERWGRRVTVFGLVTVAVGLAAVAVVVPLVPTDRLAVAILLPMLVAGIGGGAVISPNTTITLSNVPNRMAGVAAGVIQTGQRMGNAMGTAMLAAVFHATASGRRFTTGLSMSLVCAVVLILIALGLAARELRAARTG
jgi:MFS family permease